MGLLQQAMKTYDSMSRIVGVTGGDGKEPLAPVGHITTKPQIRITIDADGIFLQAEAIDELKVIIPVTEQSAGRTSGICPHPICDQVGYITDSNQKNIRNIYSSWKGGLFRLQSSESESCIFLPGQKYGNYGSGKSGIAENR